MKLVLLVSYFQLFWIESCVNKIFGMFFVALFWVIVLMWFWLKFSQGLFENPIKISWSSELAWGSSLRLEVWGLSLRDLVSTSWDWGESYSAGHALSWVEDSAWGLRLSKAWVWGLSLTSCFYKLLGLSLRLGFGGLKLEKSGFCKLRLRRTICCSFIIVLCVCVG